MSKINPSVVIMLDKERHLKVDFNALVTIEESTGKKITDPKVLKELITNMSLKTFQIMLWALLLDEDDTLTFKQAGKLINPNNMAELAKKISEAWDNYRSETTTPLAGKPRSGTG